MKVEDGVICVIYVASLTVVFNVVQWLITGSWSSFDLRVIVIDLIVSMLAFLMGAYS